MISSIVLNQTLGTNNNLNNNNIIHHDNYYD